MTADDGTLLVRSGRLDLQLRLPDDGPVAIAELRVDGARSLVAPHALVTMFTMAEQQLSRMSATYADSAIGQRMRYLSHLESSDDDGTRVEIVQHDPLSELTVTTVLTMPLAAPAIGLTHTVTNAGAGHVVLLSVSSASVGFGLSTAALDDLDLIWAASGWTAEGRWQQHPLRDVLPPIDLARYGQDTARRFGLTSSGTWSTGEFLPVGMIVDRSSGAALAWQIESSGSWHWEVGHTPTGGYLALLGPTDAEHQFAARLAPGESFITPPAVVALSQDGRDGAFSTLTDYRRGRHRQRRIDGPLPIIYNDFMNTLMGDPSTEQLEPLIRAAAESGVEYFCIDAGWFARAGDDGWWSRVGAWREGDGRFNGGLAAVVELIRSSGMVPGLWLEPEAIGVDSALAASLPDDAFFRRLGARVVTQQRYQLDFRHEAARAHMDATIDLLVQSFGIGYFKLDCNTNPRPGTDVASTSAAEGLLGHVRAHRRWLERVQERHPHVLFETCAAGAMRMDSGLLSLAHIQSTSDQPDSLLYPAIAASAPASMLPEQCGNWAYPSSEMDAEQTAFSLVAGLIGRLYLSGFLDRLDMSQRELVNEAVIVSKEWRSRIAVSHPVWPLGLPAWESPQLAIALDCGDEYLVAVWSRGSATALTLEFPRPVAGPVQVFPASYPTWPTETAGTRVTVALPAGPAARLIRLAKQSRD